MNSLEKVRTKETLGMNDVQYNLLTAIEMYLCQVDRLNGINIYAAGYEETMEEQAMGMYKLVGDIVQGENECQF
jgi:hypothetical protein